MNAKEFLMRGINLERRVETIREQIEHYKALVNDCSVTYSDSPKSTASNYKLEDCTQKIMDLQEELCSTMADLVDVTCEIGKAIQKLDNYDYQDLLVKRYVLGKPWEKIAEEMNYGIRNVHRLHGEALREIKIFS
jgi:transposase-like protein